MRIVVALMLGLFLTATAFAATGTRSGHAARRPALTVSGGSVHGMHFVARERVTVTVDGGDRTAARSTQASAAGRFATQLPNVDPCLGPLVVTARGATGDGARLKLPQRACPPAD
jgi:hypothetical protein